MADLTTKLALFLDDLWKDILKVTGTKGQITKIAHATELVATTTGAGTEDTVTDLIPANSIVFGVTVRVTTVITGGAIATFGVGTAADADAWGATTAVAVAADSHSHLSNFTITSPTYYAAATKVRLTANAGTFSTGAVRVCVHYLTLTAPTS
jgi:hypothetical protein